MRRISGHFCVSTGRDSAANPAFYGYFPADTRAYALPPRAGIWQDYRDIHKLFKRQEVAPISSGLMFRLMPWVLISSMLVLAMALPLYYRFPFAGGGDLITLIYLLALFRFFFALSGLDTGSPFAGVGASRELTLGILVEPMLILSLLVLALIAGSTHIEMISNTLATGWNSPLTTVLALLACGFACFIEMGKIPFDVAEAEQELQEGPLTEYSGAGLALAKWGLGLKQVVMAALFVALFLPFERAQELSLACLLTSLVVTLLKVLLIFVLASIAENTLARGRFLLIHHVTWLGFSLAALAWVFWLTGL